VTVPSPHEHSLACAWTWKTQTPGRATDPRRQPVVVVDPRAGQGPGIVGFKAQSEIG
jgi:hypothetical protein